MSTNAGNSCERIVFVGTGVSTGIPVIGHIGGECACVDAIANPSGPNRRNNVSLLVQHRAGDNLLIDCGKTFRDAYFRTLQPRGVSKLHSVFLTHDHADAIFGLDDLRDLQHFRVDNMKYFCSDAIPVYLSQRTYNTLNKGLDYVLREAVTVGPAEKPFETAPAEVELERRVACLRLHMVDDTKVQPMVLAAPFDTIPTFSVPVFHGGDYKCLGYSFGGGEGKQCLVYLSDISGIPDDVKAFLKLIPVIDVLVVDMLLPDKDHFSHLGMHGAWSLIKELNPRRAYGVGMYCDIEQTKHSAILAQWLEEWKATQEGAESRVEFVGLAYDGLELEMNL